MRRATAAGRRCACRPVSRGRLRGLPFDSRPQKGESMAELSDIRGRHVRNGALPGAVGLVVRGDRAEVAAVGSASVGGAPMTRESIFRIASITKPITAASLMMLVEDGRIAPAEPVGE